MLGLEALARLPLGSQLPSLVLPIGAVSPLWLGTARASTASTRVRVPPLRGALRFWFRALCGEQNLTELAQQESALFGSTKQGSRVLISLRGTAIGKPCPVAKPQGKSIPPTGHGYLGYSFFVNKRDPHLLNQSWSLRMHLPTDTGLAQQAEAALWVFLHLGGLGMRSRRGYGSVQYRGQEDTTTCAFRQYRASFDSAQALAEELAEGLSAARTILAGKTPNGSPAYPVLDPAWAKVAVLNFSVAKPSEALDKAGRAYFDWRIGNNYTAPNNQGTGLDQKHVYIKRKELGLPLKGVTGNRLASPLFFKTFQLAQNCFTVVLTAFRHERSPQGLALTFLDTLIKDGKALPVRFA